MVTFLSVKKQVTICSSAIEACERAEAVVIATEWKEFKEIDWEKVYAGMNKPAFVFDGRLLVDSEKLTEIGFKVRFPYYFILSVIFADRFCLLFFLFLGHDHRQILNSYFFSTRSFFFCPPIPYYLFFFSPSIYPQHGHIIYCNYFFNLFFCVCV